MSFFKKLFGIGDGNKKKEEPKRPAQAVGPLRPQPRSNPIPGNRNLLLPTGGDREDHPERNQPVRNNQTENNPAYEPIWTKEPSANKQTAGSLTLKEKPSQTT